MRADKAPYSVQSVCSDPRVSCRRVRRRWHVGTAAPAPTLIQRHADSPGLPVVGVVAVVVIPGRQKLEGSGSLLLLGYYHLVTSSWCWSASPAVLLLVPVHLGVDGLTRPDDLEDRHDQASHTVRLVKGQTFDQVSVSESRHAGHVARTQNCFPTSTENGTCVVVSGEASKKKKKKKDTTVQMQRMDLGDDNKMHQVKKFQTQDTRKKIHTRRGSASSLIAVFSLWQKKRRGELALD